MWQASHLEELLSPGTLTVTVRILFFFVKNTHNLSDVSHHSGVPFVLIRKEPKDHGTGKIVELDIETASNLVLVDDVMSSGSTAREAIANIRRSGVPLKVVAVLCIVNRCLGAPSMVPETDIPLHSLFTLEDLIPKRKSFAERATLAPTRASQLLFQLMQRRQTNLCFSADLGKRSLHTYSSRLVGNEKPSSLFFLDSGEELIRVLRQVAPFIVAVKVHFDAVKNLNVAELFRVARANQLLVIGDRKFADIGATVRKQLAQHPAATLPHVMDACTIHTIAGTAGVRELAHRKIGAILIGEMSNAGNSVTGDRVQDAAQESSCISGVVCQARANCEIGDGVVYFTPGVHLEATTDGGDQRYRDCYQAIAVQQNDVVIVGRGIYADPNPAEAAERYQHAAWSAHTARLN
jgi:orotidine 5'-phosphate decarboxylase subfamily 1